MVHVLNGASRTSALCASMCEASERLGPVGDPAVLSASFSHSTCFSPGNFWDGVPAQPLQFLSRDHDDDFFGYAGSLESWS